MYESHFGFTGLPFQLSPDPAFFFDGAGHREARAALSEGLASGARLLVVTGDIGAGKTTLLRSLLDEWGSSTCKVIHIAGAHLDADALSEMLGLALGLAQVNDPDLRRAALLRFLGSATMSHLLVIDEAQHLVGTAFDLLESIVLATPATSARLQVCIAGQPELRALLQAAERRAFRERIQVDVRLGPLDTQQAAAYIQHRLRKVGWCGQPSFDPAAVEQLHAASRGIPRRLNVLCNRLLLAAFLDQQEHIDAAAVQRVAAFQRAEFGEGGMLPQVTSQALPDIVLPAVEDQKHVGQHAEPALRQAPVRPVSAFERPVDQPTGALLCVAADHDDHVQAAALLRALKTRKTLPPARLVCALRNDALSLNGELFMGLEAESHPPLFLDISATRDPGLQAEMEVRFESLLSEQRPSAVVVFNSSESALACARVAHRQGVPVIHLGAGQRDALERSPPDLTRAEADGLADLLCTDESESARALELEGHRRDRLHATGSMAMDALRTALHVLGPPDSGPAQWLVPTAFKASRHGWGLVGLSAPAHIADRQTLQGLLKMLAQISRDLPLIWPINLQTHRACEAFKLYRQISGERIVCLPTQPYLNLVDLMRNATCVLTDSWAMQDEAFGLSIPCLMFGEHTRRATGFATLAAHHIGSSSTAATRIIWQIAYSGRKTAHLPAAWDGRAAERVSMALERAWPELRRPS